MYGRTSYLLSAYNRCAIGAIAYRARTGGYRSERARARTLRVF